MRMVERRNGSRLAFEALADLGPLSGVWRKHLDGDGAVQPRVARFVHLTHAAGAQRRDDLVGSQKSSGGKRHIDLSDSTLLRPRQGGFRLINALATAGRRSVPNCRWP